MSSKPQERRLGPGANEQKSTGSIASQPTPVTPSTLPFTSPPASVNAREAAGLSQSRSLIDSQNLVITDGQFNQTHGHHISVGIHINPDPQSSSPPLNETGHINPARFSDTSTQTDQPPASSQSQKLPLQKSNDIYQRHLTAKGRGFPLWIPGPNENLDINYRRTGVRIGDVGIITDFGGFSFLFNICLPHDDPVNPRMLPENFAPISPPIEASDIEKLLVFKKGSHLASASVKRLQTGNAISDIVFESSASEGAILTMPQGARSEDLGNLATVREYATANVTDWYKFVNGPRGREAKNGDVRLVVGFDKTTSWGIATFANHTQQHSCRLKFVPSESDSTSTYAWEYSGVAEVRAGPDSEENDELKMHGDPPDVQFRNQCLFVRTLNVTLADDVWADIHSSSGSVHVDPPNSQYPRVKNYFNSNRPRSNNSGANDGSSSKFPPSQGAQSGTQRSLRGVDIASNDNSTIFVSGPVESITAHPSKVLNDTLLAAVPTAKMVITHDDDWTSLAQNALLDPQAVLANILASQDIHNDNGVVFLQPKRIANEMLEGAQVMQGPSAKYVAAAISVYDPSPLSDDDPDFPKSLGVKYDSPKNQEMVPQKQTEALKNTLKDRWFKGPRVITPLITTELLSSSTQNKTVPPARAALSPPPRKLVTESFHSTMLPNLHVSVYYALTTFETELSPWIHPSEWLDANTKHICAIFDGIVKCTKNQAMKLPEIKIFQRLIVYIFAYNMLCWSGEEFSDDLNATLNKYRDWDILDLIRGQGNIKNELVTLFRNASPGHREKQFDDLLKRLQVLDSIALSAHIEVLIADETSCEELIETTGAGAQSLVNLLQARLDFPVESGHKRLFVRVLTGLSERSGVYPESLTLNNVTRERGGARVYAVDVYKGRCFGEDIALKDLEIPLPFRVNSLSSWRSSSKDSFQSFIREVIKWRQISHPNVLPIYGVCFLLSRVYLVSPWTLEIPAGIVGFLARRHHKNPYTDTTDCVCLALDIACGVQYLHGEEIIHGNLKGYNILISPSMRAYIGLPTLPNYWFAGLISLRQHHTYASDIYAFALVCYEMFSGEISFGDIQIRNLQRMLERGARPSLPTDDLSRRRGLTPEMKDLIRDCSSQEPTKRPTADKVVERLRLLRSDQDDERPPNEIGTSFFTQLLRDQVDNPFAILSEEYHGLGPRATASPLSLPEV